MRRKFIFLVHKKNLALRAIGIFILAVILTFIFGIGMKYCLDGNFDTSKFSMKNGSVIFDNKRKREPKLKIYITKENKVKDINLEEYIVGVVAAEVPVEFDMEALKAQAVAARTFALAHMEEFGGKKYKSDTGANVCDTVKCQVYINKEDKLKTWPKSKRDEYWNKINKAVKETQGEYLTFNRKLVMEPYYFAVSPGKTEDSEDAFSESVPYLKSVESPGEEKAPKYKSTVRMSYKNFIDKIKKEYPSSDINTSNVRKKVYILSKCNSGYVKEIKLGSVTISGSKFRNIMGLNSANFDISFTNDRVSINCIGYGHGVGMSQWGANSMAKSGEKYDGILKHYYSGVKIERLNY